MLVNSKKDSFPLKNFSTRNYIRYLTAFVLLGNICLLANPAHALIAVAETGNTYPGIGYGAAVLDSLLNNWKNPDSSAEGVTSVTLRIANDGRPFSCEIRRFSSSQVTDTSICDAVAQIGKFPIPTNIQNTEITLTFVHKNTVIQNTNLDATQNTEKTIEKASPELNASKNVTTQATTGAQTPAPLLQESGELKKKNIESNTNKTSSNVATNNSANTTMKAQVPQKSIPTQKNPDSKTIASAPVATYLKEDIQITREEALLPPSENLVLPAEAMKEYSQNVFNQAVGLIRVPTMPVGAYKTITRVDIDPKGILKNSVIQTSSGVDELDNEILRVLREEIKYPPTPHNDHQSIWLTFIIRK